MTHEELLAQLTKLLPPQFEGVLFRARIPLEYLSASSSPQATRAIEVLRYLEQQNQISQLAGVIEAVVAGQRVPSILDVHRSGVLAPLVVAAATGAAALGLLLLMLSSAHMLVQVGLTDHIWYALLLVLGLFAAVTVFALFKSYGRYRGRALGRTLMLGGPVVVMLVVVPLAFVLAPAPAQRFDVTVFLHGKAGRQAVVLRNHGRVSLDLGADKRIEDVGSKGEARFAGIPGDLRDREVTLGLEDDIYELVNPTIRLDQEAVYAAIQPRQLLLVGYVADEHGHPLSQARAVIAKATAVTDQDGRFEIKLPADLPEGDRSIIITAAGYEPGRYQTVPGGDPLRVRLSSSSDGK